MKMLLTCGAVLGLLGLSVLGIPQTFGTNQFLNTAGVSFEEFAADPAAWGAAAVLKGHWAARLETLTLTDSAVVFGITADQVTAKLVDGQVQSFRVVFRAKDKRAGGKQADLPAQVRANVQAFTGERGLESDSGQITFQFKTVTITLYPSTREVVAEFKRA
jgi:hypothetical protein